jgi:hypothetical protein
VTSVSDDWSTVAFSQDGVVRDERNLVMRLCVSDQALARMRSYEDKKITDLSCSL